MYERSKTLHISITPIEDETLEKVASENSMNKNELVRFLIFNGVDEKELIKEAYSKLKEKQEELKNANLEKFKEIINSL